MRGPLLVVALLAGPVSALAQDLPDTGPPPQPEALPGGALEADGYVALSADQRAQMSLGGFRSYLERTRASDPSLYDLIAPPLRGLEERETAADVIFWVATGLSVGALIAAIPVYEELGLDPAIGFLVGGASTFVLGLIVQAVVRPGHRDLMRLIDLYDERLGRR